MTSPISARLPNQVREKLARYCAEQQLSQTDAIAKGIELLLNSPVAKLRRRPEDVVASFKALRRSIRSRLSDDEIAAWQSEGRD